MITPAQQRWPATYYDGVTPTRRDAVVTFGFDGLVIRTPTLFESIRWSYAESELAQGQYSGETVRIENAAASLLIDDRRSLEAWKQYASEASGAKGFGAVTFEQGVLAIVALLAILGGTWVWGGQAAGGLAAATLPIALEQRLGASVMQSLAPEEARCNEPARREALNALVARLESAIPDSPYTWRVSLVDGPVNAFAAPGGHIVIFDGLVELVSSPEELAGVLAHEMQHVEQRHSVRALFRQMTFNALLAALGAHESWAAGSGSLLTALAFAREDESSADREGLKMLERAGIDGSAMADVFRKFAEMELDMPAAASYLSTHPDNAERAAVLESLAAPARPDHKPVLTPEQWRALRKPCIP